MKYAVNKSFKYKYNPDLTPVHFLPYQMSLTFEPEKLSTEEKK